MTSFVVDANVAIKWVLTEIYTDNASRLLSPQ
ncbi:MAG: type II toxin-antitoxin system VapC family toxin [Microcystis aeruginosa L211-07]|nr:type II toxin-antitoxin system VapC family toxin [Microcystis aeruginosa L211-07]